MLILEADMAAQGRLVVLGAVRLEGRYEGTIICSRLEVGTDGYLLGNVLALELQLAGQIVGTVRASRVVLLDSGILEGELFHETLQMDGSATLVGESRRQKSLEMPEEFTRMQTRARRTEDDIRNLEVEHRVRRVDEAIKAEAQFKLLRARFPVQAARA